MTPRTRITLDSISTQLLKVHTDLVDVHRQVLAAFDAVGQVFDDVEHLIDAELEGPVPDDARAELTIIRGDGDGDRH